MRIARFTSLVALVVWLTGANTGCVNSKDAPPPPRADTDASPHANFKVGQMKLNRLPRPELGAALLDAGRASPEH